MTAILQHLDAEADIAQRLLASSHRTLLCGALGADRVTPGTRIARQLAAAGTDYALLCADPALPAFGVPGALNLGRWHDGGWAVLDIEPLCSLDGVRFRLPLVAGVARLLRRHWTESLILLAPGLAAGVGGAELLTALVLIAGIEAVVFIQQSGSDEPLPDALAALRLPVFKLATPRGPLCGKPARRAHRDRLWREYRIDERPLTLNLAELTLVGTPPPLGACAAWPGRLVALLQAGRMTTMGSIIGLRGGQLQVRVATEPGTPDQLLLRDAEVVDGHLRSIAPPVTGPRDDTPAPAQSGFLAQAGRFTVGARCGPVPVARIGAASACLINGVFGDPLLKLQLLHRNRGLLFDLGDPGRLAAREAHQVSDVFFSHTHADHIGGFMWFLRSRIGLLPACRLFGPPGLARQIAGLVGGILWDRIDERAPRFEIREWHDDHLRLFRVVAGAGDAQRLDDLPLVGDMVWRESAFRVRAVRLDHRTPVMAYAWESALRVKVRRERLEALGLKPGRWLHALKQAVIERRFDAPIETPDGARHRASALAEQLLITGAGEKLVYATDFADTPDNRRRLVGLASGAHSLFCESTFLLEHADQARRTQHLTTRACAEIAVAAGVSQLLPFHFSKRYVKRVDAVYRELGERCPQTVLPGFMAE